MKSVKKSAIEQGGADKAEVMVFLGEGKAVRQPASFRCCPLGLQFYSKKELPLYQTLDLKLTAPEGAAWAENLNCTGVVVHSKQEKESNLYRIGVMFLDLPAELRKKLHCVSKKNDFLCPHCENY